MMKGRMEKISFVKVKKQKGWKIEYLLINGEAQITAHRVKNFLSGYILLFETQA